MAAAMAAAMSEFDFEEQAARPWQPPAPARCFLHVFFSEFEFEEQGARQPLAPARCTLFEGYSKEHFLKVLFAVSLYSKYLSALKWVLFTI